MDLRKILITISCVLSLMLLSACKPTASTKESSSNSFNTEDTIEVSRILEEANKQMKEQSAQQLKEKQDRINSGEAMVAVTGEVIDLFNKPDSGFDFYQITLNVADVVEDPNQLYQDNIGKEAIFFVSPSENTHLDFKTLKPGSKVIISVFQDATVTDGAPKQTSEEDVTKIQIVD